MSSVSERLVFRPYDSRANGLLVQCELWSTKTSSALFPFDTGGDKVTVPMRRGRTAQTLRITQIISHDKAMLRLRAW